MKLISVALGDVLAIADTGTWGEEGDTNTGSAVLRSSNIQDCRLDLTDVARCLIPEKDKERRRLANGDIVVTTSRGSPEHIGKCCLFHQPNDGNHYYFSNFTLRLRADAARADPRWIFYWLSSDRGRAVLTAMNDTTSGLRNLNKTRYLAQRLPLPPLPEQKRIAAILDKADGVRRKRQQAADVARRLENALFEDMFTKGHVSRRRYPLGSLCTVIRDGVHKTPTYVGNGIPFVTVKNLTALPNGISFVDCKFITPSDHVEFSKRTNPEIGDILVSKDGTIGVAREITTGLPFNIFVSVALLKPIRDLIHPTFLTVQLNGPFVQRQILEQIKGIAIRHLHLCDFKTLSIIVPSMEAQLAFVSRIKHVHRFEGRYALAISAVDKLFASLVQRAFRGEL